MNQNTVLTGLRKATVKRTWTDDQLRAMPQALLKYIAISNGIATACPPEYKEELAGKAITDGDQEAALKMYGKTGSKAVSHSAPQTHMNTIGGSMYYTPTEVVYSTLAGQQQVRANAPIPTRFGEGEVYSNVQAVASLGAQLVTHDGVNWQSAFKVRAWAKVLEGSNLNATGFITIASNFVVILNNDTVWKNLSTISKNNIGGAELLLFVRSALDRLDEVSYDLLNTRIVIHLLEAYIGEDNEWFRRDDQAGNPIIPLKAYERKTQLKKESKEVLAEEGYPFCFMYKGGFLPTAYFPPAVSTIESAKKSCQQMTDLMGGSDAPSLILANMRGHSGMNDNFGKRIEFLSAAILKVWSMGRVADVVLSTVGDAVMLQSTANKWKLFIETSTNKVSWASAMQKDPIKFILPSVGDISKVKAIEANVIYTPRQDSVIIHYQAGHLPTPASKDAVLDYELESLSILPTPWQNRDYIVYSQIYGKVCFQGRYDDSKVKDVHAARIKSWKPWEKKTFVYVHGPTINWRGILTTFKDFSLIGYGPSNSGTVSQPKWDMDVKTLVPVLLEEIQTPEAWYDRIARDCKGSCFSFMNPLSRFSPISNLPYISKAGVQIVVSQVIAEDGTYIPNTVAVRKQTIVSKTQLQLDPSDKIDKKEKRAFQFTRTPLPEEADPDETLSQAAFERNEIRNGNSSKKGGKGKKEKAVVYDQEPDEEPTPFDGNVDSV